MECYYCEGNHLLRDYEKVSEDKSKYNLNTADLAKKYKDKLRQAFREGNITVNKAVLSSTQELTYSMEQAEQLMGNLSFSDGESDWLDRYITHVTIDEVSWENVILYKFRVNNLEVDPPYDIGASINVMSKWFFKKLQNKPRLLKCKRNISGAGGEALVPVGECIIQLHIGKKIFRDRAMAIENLKCNYILGQVLHKTNRFGSSYLTTGIHYITVNGEMMVQAISQTVNSPLLKTKGKVTLPPSSNSIVGIKTPIIQNTNILYELNVDTFQLPKGIIPLDVLHRVDHKTPQSLNIPILNTNNSPCSITKNSAIATSVLAGKCEEIQEVSWSRLQWDTTKFLDKTPQNTNVQLEPHTKSSSKSVPDVDIPEEARVKLQDLLDRKFIHIMSQTTTDIDRTNLIELDIPTEGPPIASKPYTVLLKYHGFVDHEIKQLEEVGIISWNMSDWASRILVVPKKEECVDTSDSPGSGKKW